MKTKITYIWFLAFFAIVSCQKEQVGRITEPESVTLTLTGYTNNQLTKTSFGSIGATDVNILWRTGDHLGLHIYKAGNVVDWGNNIVALLNREVVQGPGFSVGSFKTTVGTLDPETDYDVKIYYPYYEFTGNTPGFISHYIPAVQTQSGQSNSEHIGLSGGFGYAEATFRTPADVSEYKPEISFTLNHKTSYIWFDITSAEGAGGFEGWKVKSITVKTPAAKYISGEALYNIATDVLSINNVGTRKYNYVTLNIPGGMALSNTQKKSAYFVTAPVALSNETLNITYVLESSDGSETKIVTHDRVISASSEALKKGTLHRFTEVIPYTNGSGWTVSAGAATVNLSAQGYANCYIVSTPGNYSFDATVIGNGEEGLLGLSTDVTQFHTSNANISPVSAELIWQTSPSLITGVSYSSGNVSFTKNGAVKGNALIAVKDISGNILWSWHIWCTDIGLPQTYINSEGYSFVVMDRNLGARIGLTGEPANDTELAESVGLHYEFGRKDPFIGIEAVDPDANLATVYDANNNVYSWPAPVATNASRGTINYLIKNPTLYVYGVSSRYDWFTGRDGSGPTNRGFYLWGNPYGFWHGTEAGNSPTTPKTPKKSIYDPCPPGWMVAPRNTFTGITTSNSQGIAAKGRIVYYQSANKAGKATWYPFSGRYGHSNSTFTNRSTTSWVWTSSFRHSNTYVPTLFSMTSTGVAPTNNYYAAYGASVRCVQQY
ncbi:MAG: hypothetical protein PHP30_05540 [Bacteroidales bacterium]|nr:hypothetical protein [Bacteroidales bacterium]MDD3989543.1 hypothetical protein [Bacteroidales bacterium]MDD4638311.1 hypothetical protein [Bacteroidales bacterium]